MHLKDHQYCEDLYDKFTIEAARRGMVHYDKFLTEFEGKLSKGEKLDEPGNAFVVNVFYMQTVGNEMIHRYETRESTISGWMACKLSQGRIFRVYPVSIHTTGYFDNN